MPEFLELITPEEAINKLINHLHGYYPETELIKTEECLNKVLACDIEAKEDIPAFSRSTVDGFAVRSKDTFGCSDTLPAFFEVIDEIKMGEAATKSIIKGQACLIHTGGMLPQGADAVVMVEHTQYSLEKEIEVYKAVPPGENIIHAGEDVKKGKKVLFKGCILRASEIGALMALGITQIEVFRNPKVGIISTGDEVVNPTEIPRLGQVRDINSYTLSAIIEKFGGKPKRYQIVKDNKQDLLISLSKAIKENDLVIVTAGSSASVRDLTADTINELGQPGVIVHGMNVRPGKPTILGVVDRKPIIGLPGNPVSAFVIAHMLLGKIMPVLRGENRKEAFQKVKAMLSINISSMAGREDWVPVKLLHKEFLDKRMVEPIFYKSNLIFSLLDAFGFAKIEPNVTGLENNSEVEVIII